MGSHCAIVLGSLVAFLFFFAFCFVLGGFQELCFWPQICFKARMLFPTSRQAMLLALGVLALLSAHTLADEHDHKVGGGEAFSVCV